MMRPFSLRRAIRKLEFARATMESASGCVIVDLNGQLCMMNPAMERLLGWSERELLGHDLHSRIHRCTHAENCPFQQSMLTESLFQHDREALRRKDGTTVPVTYLSSPLVIEGRIAGTVLTFQDVSRQEQEIRDLRESEQRYRYLAEASPEPTWLTDQFGYITMANQRAADLFGYASWAQMLQINTLELFALDDRPRATQSRHHAAQDGAALSARFNLLKGTGTTPQNGARQAAMPPMLVSFPAEVQVSAVLDTNDKPVAYLYTAEDPNLGTTLEAVRPEEPHASMPLEQVVALALASSSALGEMIPRLLEAICEHGDWDIGTYWQVDTEDQLLRCHTFWHVPELEVPGFHSLCHQLSFAPGVDLPGRVWTRNEVLWIADIVSDNDILRSLVASKEGLHGAFCFPISVGGALQGVMEFISRDARPPDGETIKSADSASAQIGWFMERHHAEKALRHQALHDSLTGLPNRALLLDRLRRALFVARETGRALSLFLIDLNGFKAINETHGNAAADELLVQVARRLHGALRDSDTVGRLAGDEFAVLLPGTPELGAIVVAEKLVTTLRDPFVIEGARIETGGSVGIALYPAHGSDASQLLRGADAAMYVAKRRSDGYAIYTPEEDLVPSSSTGGVPTDRMTRLS